MSDEPSRVDMSHLQQENLQLRKAVYSLVNERSRMTTKLVGVQNLAEQLQERDEQIQSLKDKTERLQDSLARAENRIAQLNIQLGNGPQTAFQGAIVTPGVSKKVLEALTQENTKLKLTLDHLVNRDNGTDLAVENKELHELIMAQRSEVMQKVNELKELKAALDATQERDMVTLQDQVKRLSLQESKLERQLGAKQTFCESLVTENERLKEVVQTVRNERVTEVSTLRKKLGRVMQSSPKIKRIMDQVACDDEDGSLNLEVVKECDDLKVRLNESTVAIQQKEEDYYRLQEVCKALETQLNENENREESLKRMLSEYENKVEDLQREHEGLSAGMEEMPELKGMLVEKMHQIMLLEGEIKLMQESLKSYEHDWKMEREEKDKFKADNQRILNEAMEVNQRFDYLKREHESLKHSKQYSLQRSPPLAVLSPPGTQHKSRYPQFPVPQTCANQVKEPWQGIQRGFHGREVVADSTLGEYTDSASTPQKPPKPAPRHYQSNESSDIQCPNCHQLLPVDLIETHMRDCLALE